MNKYKRSNLSEYKTYLCDYKYQNQTWSVDIKATSLEDAYKRLIALASNGKIIGEAQLRVYVPLKETWLQKLRAWIS